jgi:hypothetical protein
MDGRRLCDDAGMDEDWDLPTPVNGLDSTNEAARDSGTSGLSAAASPTHLKLDLLENGIDFIRSGIENHFGKDESDSRKRGASLACDTSVRQSDHRWAPRSCRLRPSPRQA